MIHAPHPALRRLFALGSAPGQALSALEAGRPALDALSRDLDALPLLSDAALAALAAALDLSPLDAAVGGTPGRTPGQESAVMPGGARRTGSPGLLSTPEGHRPPVPSSSAAPQRRAASVRGVPEAMPAPASGLQIPGRIPEQIPEHIPEHILGQIQGLLERYAPEGEGRPFGTASWGSPPRARSGDLPGTPQHRAGGGASGQVREGAAVPEHDTDRHPPRPRPRFVSEPRLRAIARSVEDAAEVLVRRAARAGSPEAATTPVGATPAPPAVERLLAEGPSRARAREMASRPRADALDAGRGPDTPPSELSRLTDAVARLERTPARPAAASVAPATLWSAGPAPETPPGPGRGEGAAPAGVREAPPESLGGFRRLLRRVAPPEPEVATPASRPAPPREAVPDLLVERMEDALLGDRLAAVLRREAMRQGIDLERVD